MPLSPMSSESPPKRVLKGIPAFMPAKDTGVYWREKMASQEVDDVIVRWSKEKNCYLVEKKT